MTHKKFKAKSKTVEKKDKDIISVHLDNLEILRSYFNNISDSEYNPNYESDNIYEISFNEIHNNSF